MAKRKINLDKLNKMLSKELKQLLKEAREKAKERHQRLVDYLVQNAYEFACYNEIMDVFENMNEEDYDMVYKPLFEGLSPTIRILVGMYGHYQHNYDPERWNFFYYPDLLSIMESWAKLHQVK